MSPEVVLTIAGMTASPESYELLVRRLGYTLTEFRAWMEATLATAILAA